MRHPLEPGSVVPVRDQHRGDAVGIGGLGGDADPDIRAPIQRPDERAVQPWPRRRGDVVDGAHDGDPAEPHSRDQAREGDPLAGASPPVASRQERVGPVDVQHVVSPGQRGTPRERDVLHRRLLDERGPQHHEVRIRGVTRFAEGLHHADRAGWRVAGIWRVGRSGGSGGLAGLAPVCGFRRRARVGRPGRGWRGWRPVEASVMRAPQWRTATRESRRMSMVPPGLPRD